MSESSLPNFFDFSGSVVLVTGGGSGLGAAISRRFAQGGASVAVNYHRSEDAAARTVSEIEAQGGHAAALQANVTDPDQTAQLIARTIEAFSRLDILINNAGIYPLSPLLELDPDEWDRVIDANLRSTFLCTQAAARQWIAQGTGGAVVNIASIEGINPAPGHSHYNAAKGGVIMATRSMANELGEHGIRVNVVSPGLLWREGIDRDWPEGVTRYRQAAPLGRLGRPAEVADACLFLASPAARWITGINLIVDGGVMTNQIY